MPGRRQRHRWGRSNREAWLLEPTLLLLLHHEPAHGYTLVEQLQEFGISDLHSRMVYRTLREMEANEWVISTWDADQTQGPPRRVYRPTALGEEILSTYIRDLAQTQQQIDNLMHAYHKHMKEAHGRHR